MIIKKIKLENIRSYIDQVIEFPLGKTLFEGDIGSGKSTILMAIEFGLFGLGSEKAGSLLRVGETEGSVSVIFESDGKDYTVQRHLVKKRNSINQDDCVLKTNDRATPYSASEIKEKVLEILNFNEPPNPKAQSVIYRYAIYTPQEEMKAILLQRPDDRLQTLRRAFRIEDYLVAKENTKDLATEIRTRSKELSGAASDIQELKSKVAELVATITNKKSEVLALKKQHTEKLEFLKDLNEKREDLRKKQLLLKEEAGKSEALIILVQEKKQEIDEGEKRINDLNGKIKKVQPRISELESFGNPSEKTEKDLKDQVRSLEGEQTNLISQEAEVRAKFNDYKSILENGVCPTCDRAVESHSFGERVEHRQIELQALDKKIQDCKNNLGNAKKTLEEKRKFDEAHSRLGDLKSSLAGYNEDLSAWDKIIRGASKALGDAEVKLSSVRSSIQKLEQVSSDLALIESKYADEDREQQELGRRISSLESSIHGWENQTSDYEESIRKKREQKEKSDKLNEYQIWIQDYFVPTVDAIEKQVMMRINQEFDSQFQKWFGMLVDDPGKQAKVDENFTPIIQQDGIDQDVTYLSGGEKTSVALAYRLALNAIVRRVSIGMHSNLLILDEPTDGFSKEQLGKVREILDELHSPQIILVSHEKELESFADQIYRVTKSDGISKIVSA